jgi:hypothetical protein
MAEIHVHTAPAIVTGSDGTQLYRHRAGIYTGINGLRMAVIDWDGRLVGEWGVDSYVHNGGGAEVVLDDGREFSFRLDNGCGSCGASHSEQTFRALIESQ